MITKLFLTNTYSNRDFEFSNNKFNIRRIMIFSMITIAIEAMMITYSYIKPEHFFDMLPEYRYHYFFFGLFALASFVVSFLFGKGVIKNSARAKYTIVLSIIISLIWGASVSYMDIRTGGTLIVYLSFLFLFTSAISIRPIDSLVAITISQIFIVTIELNSHIAGAIVNTSLFSLFAWIVSRQQYSNEYEHFKMNEMLKRKNKELLNASITDHLSGLYNRLYLDEKIVELWTNCFNEQTKFSIIMTDINNFKTFNDRYGHIKGDIYLTEVAKALKKFAKRNNGYAFRYGGDEFCLIFESETPELNYMLQRKLDATIFTVDSRPFKVSASIGYISIIPDKIEGAWEIIDKADRALYINKGTLKRRAND